MRPRVVVTGIGLLTPLGDTPEAVWQALIDGKCAARSWPDLEEEGLPITRACRVVEGIARVPDTRRGQAMALVAARAATEQAQLPRGGQVGVYVGTTMGESAAFEAAAEGTPLNLQRASGDVFAQVVMQELELKGPRRTYGTACAAGNYAIAMAAAAVARGEVDAALAGGVEPISRIALVGFARLRAMTSDVCRPFDRDRRGMQLGEASAFLVLERSVDAHARGVLPLATIAGHGLTCDAYHPTAPRMDGSGMAACMKKSLQSAQVEPRHVGWVCAHGTGTVSSDLAEARALHTVFGGCLPPVSSLKGALGHSLGAASAVEAAVCVMALLRRVVPPNVNLNEMDQELGLDIIREPRKSPRLKWALNCGYGFGGVNSAVLLGRA